jgi:hypothetical protein
MTAPFANMEAERRVARARLARQRERLVAANELAYLCGCRCWRCWRRPTWRRGAA